MASDIQLDNFAHFGDGNTCLILRRRKYRGEDGITYWEFFFRPNRRIIKIYPHINDEINPIDGSVRKDYPETEVKIVDENPNHLRVWIFTDFDGNPTPVSRIDDDKDLQILNLQKRSAVLELEISELHNLLRNKMTPEAYIAQAANIIKKSRTAAAKIKTGGEGEIGDIDDENEF